MRWVKVFLIFLLELAIEKGYGQVIGQLRDTASARNCEQALLSILRPDSSLVRSTLSSKDGRFQFPGDWPAGNYILLVMHPDYITSFRPFVIGNSGAFDFGVLAVLRKIDSLRAVVVTPGDLRPRFHRDTVEYNTAYIKTNINANVEEMLGRLPGLQIDADGNVTYNGQKIQRVLMDGREIFGSDLTILTRNLNANMIAKVQVIDSKTKEAQFTGIDNGQRVKTLNLTLKDESKKGYFVKAEEGADAQKYYRVSGILGAFQAKQQFLILALASNNGSKGVASGMNTDLYIGGSFQDPLGTSAGPGIPQTIGGAIYYANDWGRYGNHGDGFYRYGNVLTRPYTTNLSEQILPDSIYTQSQQSNSINRTNEQNFNSHFTYNLDSLSIFQLALRAGNYRGQNQFASNANSSFNDTLVNDSRRSINSDVFNQSWSSDIMWRIQGRKKRNRVFSVITNISELKNNTSGYLYSINNFYYPTGLRQSADTIDQRKSINTSGTNMATYINYTEPLWERVILGISYNISTANNQARQSTFDRGDGKYRELVDSLSSDYRDNFLTQRGTLNLQGQGKHFDYVLGGDLLQYNYRERNLTNDSLSQYHFINVAPRFTVNYNPNSSESYAFSYAAAAQLPSFGQLQPIRNDNDPMHITFGNPNLRPSYSHSVAFNFHRGKLIIYTFGFNFGLINNSISIRTNTDILGRQISQAINTNGTGNGLVYFYLNTRIKPLEMDVSINNNISYDRTVNYVDDFLNKNDSYTASFGLSLTKYVANVYNFHFITNFLYSTTSSSINTDLKTSYWSQNHIVQLGFFPWKNWEINTNCNYTWRQKTSIFDNNNSVLLLNAALNKNFLNNTLTTRLGINDILGQNAGITRTIAANQISQTNSNVIGRYWMLSILYRFTKKGGK